MADSLVWACIRDNNSFMYKRGREASTGAVKFSSEPGNVMNVSSFKYSGLANSKAIGVQAKAGGGIEFVRKNAKSANKPSKATSVISLKVPKARTAKVIKKLSAYRADLASAANAKYNRLHQAEFAKGSKPRSDRNGNTAGFEFTKLRSFRGNNRTTE